MKFFKRSFTVFFNSEIAFLAACHPSKFFASEIGENLITSVSLPVLVMIPDLAGRNSYVKITGSNALPEKKPMLQCKHEKFLPEKSRKLGGFMHTFENGIDFRKCTIFKNNGALHEFGRKSGVESGPFIRDESEIHKVGTRSEY